MTFTVSRTVYAAKQQLPLPGVGKSVNGNRRAFRVCRTSHPLLSLMLFRFCFGVKGPKYVYYLKRKVPSKRNASRQRIPRCSNCFVLTTQCSTIHIPEGAVALSQQQSVPSQYRSQHGNIYEEKWKGCKTH